MLVEATRQFRRHYSASSATAELVGICIALDLLLELELASERCALLSDFRVALLRIQEGNPCSLLVGGVREKMARLADRGSLLQLQC